MVDHRGDSRQSTVVTAAALVCFIAAAAVPVQAAAWQRAPAPALAPAAVSVFAPGRAPNTSLATVPVGYFGGNAAHRNDKNIEMLAKMRIVMLEKWEGPCWQQCLGDPKGPACQPMCDVEANITRTMRRIKAVNPDVVTVMYLNTLLAFPFYSSVGRLSDADGLTRDSVTGKQIQLTNDNGMTGIFVYGHDTAVGRQMYVDQVRNFSGGVVDGFFGDKWAVGPKLNAKTGVWQICNKKQCGTLSASQAQAWIEGKISVLQQVTQLMGAGPYFANGSPFNGTVDSNFHGPYMGRWFNDDPMTQIEYVRNELQIGKYVYLGMGDQHWTTNPNDPASLQGTCVDDCLARFLLVVEPGVFLGANGWDASYDRALGDPMGPAVFQNATAPATLTRSFGSGTKVVFTYDHMSGGKGTGVITWGP